MARSAGRREALRVFSEMKRALSTTQTTEIEADLQTALAIAHRQQAKAFELRAAISLCRLWAEGGDSRKAHDTLALFCGRSRQGLRQSGLAGSEDVAQCT